MFKTYKTFIRVLINTFPRVRADDNEKRITDAGDNINNPHGKLFQVIIVTDKNAHADIVHN